MADLTPLAARLREAATVLDEPFHHDAIAADLLTAADALGAAENQVSELRRFVGSETDTLPDESLLRAAVHLEWHGRKAEKYPTLDEDARLVLSVMAAGELPKIAALLRRVAAALAGDGVGAPAPPAPINAPAWLNGLERDEANDRLETLREQIQKAIAWAKAQLEHPEKPWMVGTLDDLLRLARPVRAGVSEPTEGPQ